jgi:hypothetical protein
MTNNSGFRTEFADNLSEVGNILTENGYDILAYTGNLNLNGVRAAGHADTPEQALDRTLADIDEDERFEMMIPGNLIKEVYQDKNPGLDQILYGNLTGMVEVEEPCVRWSKEEDDWIEAEPSADPVSEEDVYPAFGLNVEYHPNQSGEGHWEVGSRETLHPYTKDDSREEVEQLAQILEENDVNYEIGLLQ